jgi:hypothetical protein
VRRSVGGNLHTVFVASPNHAKSLFGKKALPTHKNKTRFDSVWERKEHVPGNAKTTKRTETRTAGGFVWTKNALGHGPLFEGSHSRDDFGIDFSSQRKATPRVSPSDNFFNLPRAPTHHTTHTTPPTGPPAASPTPGNAAGGPIKKSGLIMF